MMGLYSCLDTDKRFFNINSRLKIINEDKITSPAPINVLNVGTSSQIKKPKIIANTNARYFSGVTRLTSDNL